ncbi:peptide transporter family 1-like isoform X2 [Contarinia nasturtii]|uniref:peptide transporter family 1-like isoform X2 n=1 Tax=Contarinia nasturtii TaxID=265458 RepID=UPI0012D3C4B9|nr:peptide transporter family 1-like isoform X2 [Contarinia nasturtii]
MGHSVGQAFKKEINKDNITNTLSNVEKAEPQKITYPKRIFLIIGNEFCERFNFNGMKAILALYLKDKLGFTENDATVLFHTLVMMLYFTCIFGAILSDVWLGKFKIIVYLSILYAIGSTIISIGVIPTIAISPKIALYIGLIFIALGSGGIKSCVIALGDIHCFGENVCYSLAFGVPALLMITAILLFILGKSSYTYVQTSSENMLMQMLKCIWNAMIVKRREGKTKPRENLLDYSIETYGEQMVNETRIMLKILVLYLPVPFFWALHFQTGSRWTFQANKMNGDIQFYTIKPDQMQMIESIFILTFIPLCELVIYPLLSKIGIRRPLQKLTIGGILMGISFVLSAGVQYQIESMPLNSVNMLWQIPQYVFLTMGEAVLAVTGLSFSYEEAPQSMKSVVLSFWYFEVALGNIILIFIAGLELFESRTYEFLFFSVLMFCSMFVFAVLAYNYEKLKKTEKTSFQSRFIK